MKLKDNYIKKFGEEEGILRYNNHCDAIKNSWKKRKEKNPNAGKENSNRSVMFYLNKGFTEEEAIKKISELQLNSHNKRVIDEKNNPEKYKGILKNQIEYWTKRGFSEKEAIENVSKFQTTFSKKICIEKYGEEIGLEIFSNRQSKWQNTLINLPNYDDIVKRKTEFLSGYSKISQLLFWEIYDLLEENNNLYFKELNKEFKIYIKNTFYSFDFVDSSKKKCIEFNGDIWHGNPFLFSNETFNFPFDKTITLESIWEKDIVKINSLCQRGYDVLIIWEYDYINSKEKVINQCLQFLGE